MKDFFTKLKASKFWGLFKKACVWCSFGLNLLFVVLLLIGFSKPSAKMVAAASSEPSVSLPAFNKHASIEKFWGSYDYPSFAAPDVALSSGSAFTGYGLPYGRYSVDRYQFNFTSFDANTVKEVKFPSTYYHWMNGHLVPVAQSELDYDDVYFTVTPSLYLWFHTSGPVKIISPYASATVSATYPLKGFPGYDVLYLDWTFTGSVLFFFNGSSSGVSENVLTPPSSTSFSKPPIDWFPNTALYPDLAYWDKSSPFGYVTSSTEPVKSPVCVLTQSGGTSFQWTDWTAEQVYSLSLLSVPYGDFVFYYPDNVIGNTVDGAFDDGYNSGYEAGYGLGKEAGKAEASPITSFSGIISNAFDSLSSILNLDLFGLSLGTWLFIPVVVGLIFLVLRIFNHG